MMRLLRVSLVGGSAPKPPGFSRFFSARMGAFVLWSWGAAVVLPPQPVPAAAPVARVASQQSPIPSDAGRLIINPAARALNEKAANGDSPLTSCLTLGVHRTDENRRSARPILESSIF